jgi:hypothetical protein
VEHLETADLQRGWVGAVCPGVHLSFFTMVAWFPKWAAGLLPGFASAGMLTGTVGEVVRQPVSALHTAVSLPVETCSRIFCSSSEEFALVSGVLCTTPRDLENRESTASR